MAQVGKENLQEVLSLPGISAEPGQKKSTLLAACPLSSSKIPVLSKRVPPEVKQSQQQQQDRLQWACPSNVRSTGIKTHKMLHTGLVPGAAVLEPAPGLLPKSLSREPLGEMQLSTSGQRNEGGVPNGKVFFLVEANTVEFVPDVAALASIMSNTGLTKHMVSASHKPSLARRIPLRGNRECSASIGAGRGCLYTGTSTVNLVRMSHISKSTSKDTNQPWTCSLALNTRQCKTLSTTLENLGARVEVAKPTQPMEKLGVGKCKDSTARLKAKSPSFIAEAGDTTQSNSAGRKNTTGTPWKDEEFVPDPAAKASILQNIGLGHSSLGANSKQSLAQQVPLKDAYKPSITCGRTRGGNACLSGARMSAPSSEKFGRISCRSTQGLKGLEKLEASKAQLANTPGSRCSAVDCSPYGLARRVPIVHPQSLRCSPWIRNCMPVSSWAKVKKFNLVGEITPQTGTLGSKQDGTAVPWEKIAVRLFEDEMAASAKKVAAFPVITPEKGKLQVSQQSLQRIELLTQLLLQEMNGGVDHDIAPSQEELHKLLSAHCSPAVEAPKPGLLTTPLQEDPKANLCKQALVSLAIAPEHSASLATTSVQQPACPSPSMNSVQLPSSNGSSTSQVKQRLDDLLSAPHRFHEACLNDECAFYTARVASAAKPSTQRCKEPVAKMLDAHDAMHFIPISAPLPTSTEAERFSPS
ncbi:tastin isoform X2 [Rhineura floridana]|uniref:tastin isoform X2 n=1 Tax=Rhineura floridana TaxID=261503 RepID=UPI002AC864EE|nr:tastin isoform X2 [Rhineura floridana]